MSSSHQGVSENRKMERADESLSSGGLVKMKKNGTSRRELLIRGLVKMKKNGTSRWELLVRGLVKMKIIVTSRWEPLVRRLWQNFNYFRREASTDENRGRRAFLALNASAGHISLYSHLYLIGLRKHSSNRLTTTGGRKWDIHNVVMRIKWLGGDPGLLYSRWFRIINRGNFTFRLNVSQFN